MTVEIDVVDGCAEFLQGDTDLLSELGAGGVQSWADPEHALQWRVRMPFVLVRVLTILDTAMTIGGPTVGGREITIGLALDTYYAATRQDTSADERATFRLAVQAKDRLTSDLKWADTAGVDVGGLALAGEWVEDPLLAATEDEGRVFVWRWEFAATHYAE